MSSILSKNENQNHAFAWFFHINGVGISDFYALLHIFCFNMDGVL